MTCLKGDIIIMIVVRKISFLVAILNFPDHIQIKICHIDELEDMGNDTSYFQNQIRT